MNPELEQALADGDLARAAAVHAGAGQWSQAARLQERLLDFAAAAAAHLQAGTPVAALRCALRARDRALESQVLEALLRDADPAALAEAARDLAAAHRPDLAARVLRALGEEEDAAAALEDAGDLAAAARLWLGVGNPRRAGQLLERHLALVPGDAAAHLELGSVLAGFGRHAEAQPLLRRAAAVPALAEAALRRLALSLAADGHPHAAGKVLEELRAVTPWAPADLAALAALAETAPTAPGTRVAQRYRLLAPRAASSLGDAYLAYDELEDQRVLLTLFRPSVAGTPALRAFSRTARAAAGADVPGLLRLVELNLAEAFMVLALPRGPSLEDWLEAGRVPPVEATLHALGRVLVALHRRGLCHGALNLANVHVTEAAEVELAEVGAGLLAPLRETESAGLQSALSLLAPEVMGGAAAGPAADQYALAAVAYRLVTGELPQAAGLATYLPPSARDGAWAPWDAPLERALAARPEARFAGVAAFLEALPAGAARPAPPAPRPRPPSSTPEPRLVPQGAPLELPGIRWTFAQDTWLGRPLALGAAAPGALAPLLPLALAPRGVEALVDLDPERAHCSVRVEPPGPAPDPAALAGALADAADALARLHAAGWAFGPSAPARLSGDGLPCWRVAGFPLPRPATPEDQDADVACLAARARDVLGPALPASARELEARLRARAEAELGAPPEA